MGRPRAELVGAVVQHHWSPAVPAWYPELYQVVGEVL